MMTSMKATCIYLELNIQTAMKNIGVEMLNKLLQSLISQYSFINKHFILP